MSRQDNIKTFPNWNKMKNISDFLESWLIQDLIDGKEQKVFDEYYSSYRNFFGEYIKYHYANQTQELMEILTNQHQLQVLEVGCGCGTETLWMALQGATVTGIDIQTNRLEVAEKRQKIMEQSLQKALPCSFEKRSIFELNSDKKYDVIWMEQAFHHIEPRQPALDKLSEIVKDKGFIVISESNAWNPLNQSTFFLKRGFSTIKDYTDSAGVKHQYGDERILTVKKLSTEFEKRNIFENRVRYFRLFPSRKWAERLAKLESNVPQWLVFPFTHYNYVGQKIAN